MRIPIRAVDLNRDFWRLGHGPAVTEDGGTGVLRGEDGRGGEAGGCDCVDDNLVGLDRAGAVDDGFHMSMYVSLSLSARHFCCAGAVISFLGSGMRE